MPIPIDVRFERTYTGTPRRIFQLLSEMGTSGDAVWPFASQPFLRSPGPLVPGQTEEWHLGMHSVLDAVDPEKRIAHCSAHHQRAEAGGAQIAHDSVQRGWERHIHILSGYPVCF